MKPSRRHDHRKKTVTQFVVEVSLTSLFVSIGRTAEMWLELRSWTGWKPSREVGRGGQTIWWAWWEMSFTGRRVENRHMRETPAQM